jgi:hypothetical protein
MYKTFIAATASLLLAAGACAATGKTATDSGITESTDPAKIAAVERHAQELQSRSMHGANSSGTAAAKSTSKAHAKHAKRSKKHTQTAAASKT